MPPRPTEIAVCIATTGRARVLSETLVDVAAQTRRPDRVVLCPVKSDDVERDRLATLPFPVEIVTGKAGLAAQRNTLLRSVPSADIVLFIDDDFLIAPNYLEELERLFDRHADCVIATGSVVADGATGPGYSVDEGRAILAAHVRPTAETTPTFNAYGCNMAVRWCRVRDMDCWFDEHLPLYAWAEDVDFSRQAAAHGTVLKSTALAGVHLAAKHGRVSGVRFGYSQIANQVYLVRKGTITRTGALRKALENIAANAVGSLRGNEIHIDRRGRLIGNLYGVFDIFRGRSSPQRIMEL